MASPNSNPHRTHGNDYEALRSGPSPNGLLYAACPTSNELEWRLTEDAAGPSDCEPIALDNS